MLFRSVALTAVILYSAFAVAEPVCEMLGEPQSSNCEKLFKNKKISPEALRYTIKYWVQNREGLRDPNCALDGFGKNDPPYSFQVDPTLITNGFQNKCTFMLNDLDKKWAKGSTRTTAYYINLCAQGSEPVSSAFYVNAGKCKPPAEHSDKADPGSAFDKNTINKCTLAGAFITEGKIADGNEAFVSIHDGPYAAMRARWAKKGMPVPSIKVVGLNSSNNTSEAHKPLHASPYNTSFGCLGVNENTAEYMMDMAHRGTSLMMNYAAGFEEKEGQGCRNDNSDDPPAYSNPPSDRVRYYQNLANKARKAK